MIYYDSTKITQKQLLSHLIKLEATALGDLSSAKMPSRIYKLPLTFKSKRAEECIQRYMETQRPYAAYLPDNTEFVAKNNAMTKKELEQVYLSASFMMVAVGFFMALPLALPVDPRQRLNCPKMNPSRVFTPAGAVAWGGSCMSYVYHDAA